MLCCAHVARYTYCTVLCGACAMLDPYYTMLCRVLECNILCCVHVTRYMYCTALCGACVVPNPYCTAYVLCYVYIMRHTLCCGARVRCVLCVITGTSSYSLLNHLTHPQHSGN